MKTQEQLDANLRKVASKMNAAIAELLSEDKLYQVYELSNGSLARIHKTVGDVWVTEPGSQRFTVCHFGVDLSSL